MRLPRRLVFIAGIALLLAGAGAGFTLWARPGAQAERQHAEPPYTCPMHPDVRQDGPGRCPICGMALEQTPPAEQKKAHQEAHGTHAAAASPPRPAVEPPPPAEGDARAPLTIDGRRRQLIGVRLVPVTEAALTRALRATGIVRFDESRWTDVNVRTEAWIRTLHVERTGERVTRGQPLFSIYSPELATAQAEYVLALRTRDSAAGAGTAAGAGPLGTQAERLVAGARQRLARWDLPQEHLATLTERREVPPVVIFRSPVSGIVMEKRAVEGMRVMPGESLYRIVDASVVWVEADVYESDLSVVRLGQRAELTFEAWTGETFSGRVSWVAPTLDEATRTTRVRIELRNPGGRLKPGMFAHANLAATLPARPVVPIDALLDSGGRQFVFVSDGQGYFEPRQVKAGARVNGQVQVLEGVTPGEQVAASATFFIDSESQLRAALEGYREAPASGAGATAAPAGTIDVALSSVPDPPRAGMTQFAATVKDREGRPVGDAGVTLVLYMPPMPSMNMPAMRSEAALGHAGDGVYRGSVDVMMNGRWEATVTVTRGATRLGAKSFTLIAR